MPATTTTRAVTPAPLRAAPRADRRAHRRLALACIAALLALGAAVAAPAPATHDGAPLARTARSGPWSAGSTWESGAPPTAGSRVHVRPGHRIVYDVDSSAALRTVHISGTLTFATDRSTRLDAGLIRIDAAPPGEHEEGFECLHMTATKPPPRHGPVPTLEIGTAVRPIPHPHRALVRLVHFEGMDPESLPALVCCGGRMEIHGAPMRRTWVKLWREGAVGETRLFLAESVDWRAGDRVVVTATTRQRPFAGNATTHVSDRPASEERTLAAVDRHPLMVREQMRDRSTIDLDRPLEHPHRVGERFAGEVANLSRNVVIESADPDGVRGHTMYHRYSTGSISYAEFRHLGKEGVLGRYPIHFHLVRDTMRGASVIGASIHDSANRWVTIHGTRYLVVRDCVGYGSIGHGFFLEDGTEVYNVLDRNIAIHALVGAPLPDQALPYDRNDGAGFWWANSLNAFTRNVAVECDQHGFRFEVEKTPEFDPVLAVPTAEGTTRRVDIRTLPFLRFDDNEAHAQRRFAVNLGGIRGKTFGGFATSQPESVGGHVDGVGPPTDHPFVIRNLHVWDAHWSFHAGSPSVLVRGMDLHDGQYGIWRSVVSLHKYEDLTLERFDSASLYFPMGGYGPKIHLDENEYPTFPITDPVDDSPPVTIVTGILPTDDGGAVITGTTVDDANVARVLVDGRVATAERPNFAEWSLRLAADALADGEVRAHAEDAAGNVEPRPHVLAVEVADR